MYKTIFNIVTTVQLRSEYWTGEVVRGMALALYVWGLDLTTMH